MGNEKLVSRTESPLFICCGSQKKIVGLWCIGLKYLSVSRIEKIRVIWILTILTQEYLRVRMQDPVLCLTVSVTLRDKPMSATAQRQELIELFKASGGVYKVVQAKPNGSVPPKDQDTDEDDVLYGLEEVNLLEGLIEGTHHDEIHFLKLLNSSPP